MAKSTRKPKKVRQSKVSEKSYSKGNTRGSLIKRMYDFFDKVGLDKATYDRCLKLAKSVKTDTKFNRYHHSWYRNDYRNKRNLPSPTTSQGNK